MLTIQGRKVIVSRDGVRLFNRGWPCSELRDRSYWFEFAPNGDLIDTDVSQHDDGVAATAMAADCQRYLDDGEQPPWVYGD